MIIKYKFSTGEVTEVEVSEEIGTVILDSRREEHASNERHRYHTAFSLDDMDYEDKDYFSAADNPERAFMEKEFAKKREAMDNNILSALKAIDVATLSRADWIAVGMALKEEGYPCSIWDDWSRNDKRYHPGECERKWNSFHGSGTPVKGGTIVQMAKERGWTPFSGEDGCLNWDDAIEYDGADGFNGFTAPDSWSPSADLITYFELLFDADDRVGYVTNDVWQDAEGKWLPSKGVYDRTAGELIASLKKHPDDLGATIGDWKPQVGAWIRFNPLDGDGVKNENITKFRFALVESDTLPVAEQDIVFRKLELPIAALVHSGGKSLHAIVRVDAENYDEYRKRVEFLYDFLEKNGVSIDKQNRNPSRLSRMPGVTRNGNRQYLVATNIGRKSWVDWMDFVEGVSDELPDMVRKVGTLPSRKCITSFLCSEKVC